MSQGYPIVLNVSARRVVIVGGGNVALRKVRGLLESGAGDIRVISPAFHSDFPVSGITRIQEPYRPEHLDGASLVFAATDSAGVNAQVVQDARAIGALVCRSDVDEDESADFATPAMVRRGPMLVAVSSGGSPALSAKVRDELARALDPRWVAMAEAMKTLRPMIRGSLEPGRRREALVSLCTPEALNELESGGVDGLKRWLLTKFSELHP
jgi:precorrin-2 dehydrogenase/sirohydrochlorin ferrochelatase